jgi:ribokinase
VAAARLGYPVKIIGKVGDDAFGCESLKSLDASGVDVTDVEIEKGGTSGIAVITVGDEGQNTIIVIPGTNASVTPAFIDSKQEVIRGAGMVLAQLEIPIESIVHLARVCRENNIPLMLDPAPAKELPAEVMASCRWLTPNQSEARFYVAVPGATDSRSISERLLHMGMEGVALKLGSDGCFIATRDGSELRTPAFPMIAVDSTAAGDTFNGAFAVCLLSGWNVSDSVTYASAAAALSVTREGAQPSMPTAAEVDVFLGQFGEGRTRRYL